MNNSPRLLYVFICGGLIIAFMRAAALGQQLSANHPAARWDNAYPVGNGSMGGMAFGSFPDERIVLNNDTIWSHPKRVELTAGSRKSDMDEVFNLCMKGDYEAAQSVFCHAKDKGNHIATYQGLGSLEISYQGISVPAKQIEIQRNLDLLTGESTATAQLPDGMVRETLLASYPDRCLVLHLETTCPQGLQCRFKLNRSAGITSRFVKDNQLGFAGQVDANGTKFAALACVIPGTGATVTQEPDTLVLKGGASATIVITSATNYHRDEPRQPRTDDWASDATTIMNKAATQPWAQLRQRAVDDHRNLMARCEINLGRTDPKVAKLSTPERLELMKHGGSDPELIATFFQFGRHMLVSSSRPGSLPPNLQGLWEPGLHAAWNGDFHLNINVQMNLWPANVTGLSECNEPFLALLKLIHQHGQETAASLGCRGYNAGLASDAWGQTDYVGGSPEWDSWALGGHWAAENLMEYYRFTQDKTFLRETAWPILKDGSLFLLDWMRPNPATGQLISGPGSSPENAFRYKDQNGKTKGANISIGNAIDHQIAWETFSDTLQCAQLLGIKNDFTAQVGAALKRVPPPAIGLDERIMEWWKPFDEVWKGHRHKSLLYGLFPGHQITREYTPQLADAAEASLRVRMDPKNGDCAGGGHTGWNLAWTANLWARLYRGDLALQTIEEQLRTQVNENLFNRCGGPFQIDGNLGTPAAVAEMLLQSHETTAEGEPLIRLLPALPSAWASGHARGLHARGGFVVDMDWDAGQLKHVKIISEAGNPATARYGNKISRINLARGATMELNAVAISKLNPMP